MDCSCFELFVVFEPVLSSRDKYKSIFSFKVLNVVAIKSEVKSKKKKPAWIFL